MYMLTYTCNMFKSLKIRESILRQMTIWAKYLELSNTLSIDRFGANFEILLYVAILSL